MVYHLYAFQLMVWFGLIGCHVMTSYPLLLHFQWVRHLEDGSVNYIEGTILF